MAVLLPAVLPVALIIIIGFIAGKTLNIELKTLSQLSVYILSPALISDSLYRTNLSPQSILDLLLGVAITSLLIFLLIWLLSCCFNLSSFNYKSLLATTLHPNNGNMGLPFVDFALGAEGLERAIIYMIGSAIILFGFAPAILTGRGLGKSLSLTLKLPLMWAILAGLTLRLLNIELPFNLGEAIHMLGRAAIPLALIILGIQLSITRFTISKYELSATILRLLIAPIIALFVGNFLKLEGLDLKVLILQSAMPTAVNTLVLVSQFGGDAPRVARTIVVTTVTSFITLPLILWLTTYL
ncbi:MAG TPA: transporter [Cyanothece sp. UBA12306]|nr:transporter [Cyanothece sp. UBA12306]